MPGKPNEKDIGDENLRVIFSEIDANNDGLIQKEELKNAMIKMGQDIDEDELTLMFEVADQDNDGRINLQEFLMISHSNPTSLSIKATFDEFDLDGNGKITRSEMKKAFTKLGHALTDQEVKEIYKKMDLNHDGKITFKEFHNMMINSN